MQATTGIDEARSGRMFRTASRLLNTGKTEDALTVIEYLTMLEPTRGEYWVAGGVARMRLGHLDQAAASFQVAEAANERDPVPVLLRAVCRLRQGHASEGLAALRRAHALALASGERTWVTSAIEKHLDALDGLTSESVAA
jgi:Flp pilus assembly protein TadD